MYKHIKILSVILILSSCIGTYGIKKTLAVSTKNINEIEVKYGIRESIIINKTTYLDFLKSISSDSLFLKNHTQPLQALYFKKEGNMISYHINCNAGGFPNLIWNKSGSLNIFPPNTQTKMEPNLSVENFFDYFNIIKTSDYDYYLFIFWNDYLGRQTKRFVSEFTKNARLEKNKKIKIIYVNNDNLYVD